MISWHSKVVTILCFLVDRAANMIRANHLPAALIGIFWNLVPAVAEETVVVELYTSQSCGMCPMANVLQMELAREPGIVALTLNVDYWDYLGWKDDLALAENGARQRAYSRESASRRVYTPQMMIDGKIDVVGSSRGEVRSAIEAMRASTDRATVDLSLKGGDVRVSILPTEIEIGDATVWLAGFDRSAIRTISGGENSGRTISYVNVVREWRDLGKWNAGSQTDLIASRPKGDGGVVVIVQSGRIGPIFGAAQLDY